VAMDRDEIDVHVPIGCGHRKHPRRDRVGVPTAVEIEPVAGSEGGCRSSLDGWSHRWHESEGRWWGAGDAGALPPRGPGASLPTPSAAVPDSTRAAIGSESPPLLGANQSPGARAAAGRRSADGRIDGTIRRVGGVWRTMRAHYPPERPGLPSRPPDGH